VLAIVPVKGLDGAKTRLARVLSPDERRALVLEMLDAVLSACAMASAIHTTLVVTPDARIERGDELLTDEGAGHARAIEQALADQRAREGALVVMADCPFAHPESLDRLAEAARPVALAPAADGGVNALALRDPAGFSPVFGRPDAARLTVEQARAAGLEAAVVDDPLLAFDVDRPADLERLKLLLA
jgi:2-phospho-L-lactate/phosphoenolpyruvate guanylyltransferase